MSTTAASAAKDISAIPAAGQRIDHDGKEYTTIREGLAYILIPASAAAVPQTTPKGDNQSQSVFYNPIQQFNRDLSVLAIKAYGEETVARKKVEREKRHKMNLKKGKKRKREAAEGNGETAKAAKTSEGTAAGENRDEPQIIVADAEVEVTSEAPEINIDVATEPVQIGDASSKAINGSAVDAASAEIAESTRINGNHPQPEESSEAPSATVIHPPPFTILDALSATGLRALRYVQEIPFTTSVTANDLLPAATDTIKLNIKHNRLEERINANTGNAMSHMYSLVGDDVDRQGRPKPSKKYDVIDLDPYGTAAPFLDGAVQAVQDGGLLCVTCTDAGVWASNGYPEKCFSLYGGVPIKGLHSHEGGLRLILHAIATSAARYGLAVEPLLSLSIDYYARVFVRVRKSAADVKFLAGRTMVVYNCDSGCGAWTTQLLARNKLSKNKSGNGTFYKHVMALAPSTGEFCEHCGSKTHMAGPMYAGPLHSAAFINRILEDLPNVSKDTYATTSRIEGMLNLALEETLSPREPESNLEVLAPPPLKSGQLDPAAVDLYPFFFIPSALSKVIHCITPHEDALRGALRHLGYRVTRSHTKAGSIKTDAPWKVVWEIMKEWTTQKAPVKEGAVREGTAGYRILGLDAIERAKALVEAGEAAKKEIPRIVFDEALGKEKDGKKLVRYQLNPRENWGPMGRAKGKGH